MIVPVKHSDGKLYDPFVLWVSILETEEKRLATRYEAFRFLGLCALWCGKMPRITEADERRIKLLCNIQRKICHLKVAKLLRDECHVPQWKALRLARKEQADLVFRIARHIPRWALAEHTKESFR